MKLLLHIHNATPSVDIVWLQRNQCVISNNWLDCTEWIDYFNPNDIHTFVCLVCEFTSVDVKFDEWRLE